MESRSLPLAALIFFITARGADFFIW